MVRNRTIWSMSLAIARNYMNSYSRAFLEKLIVLEFIKKYLPLFNLKHAFPYLQKPITASYPKQDESNP
jgi:hypothetical protein